MSPKERPGIVKCRKCLTGPATWDEDRHGWVCARCSHLTTPAVDLKFVTHARSLKSGTIYDETTSIVFLVRDPAVPDMLSAYAQKCEEIGCDDLQLTGIMELRERVDEFHEKYPERIKLADIEDGAESERIMGFRSEPAPDQSPNKPVLEGDEKCDDDHG